MSYVVLGVLVVLVIVAIVKLRPILRERRYEAWRRAGLLPDQLDRASDGTEPEDPRR